MSLSKIVAIIVVAALIIWGVVALTRKSNTPTTTKPATSTSETSTNTNKTTGGSIEIKNMMFTPSQITVSKGESVTWTNNDDTAHTVTDDLSDVGGPDSGSIAPGSTYSFTFNKTGSFQYHCTFHTSMRGTIVVK